MGVGDHGGKMLYRISSSLIDHSSCVGGAHEHDFQGLDRADRRRIQP